jgi:prepilin-type N-terminal cleavage/methylation domain-containing protein
MERGSSSKPRMIAASWARLRLRELNNSRCHKLRRCVGQVGSALAQNAKSFFNVAFPGQPPRLCRSLAPPNLGRPRSFLNSALMGLKCRSESCHPFGIKTRYRSAGLSLIELLVVVAIIAAISALITTSVMSALSQQNQRICLNNMLTIEAAKDEYIRDHPGATSVDQSAFQQYFRFGIPRCPDNPNEDYRNLYELTQQVYCKVHPENQQKLSAAPSPQ